MTAVIGQPADASDPIDLLTLLDLEPIEADLYRANAVFAEEYALYGGQVAAQALRAAGATVDPGRRPHSLHAYFLRPGDPRRPTVFRVSRDRDGGTFSARRVVAVQNGKVILNLTCSFHLPGAGPHDQVTVMPEVPSPQTLRQGPVPRLFSYVGAMPKPQPYADRAAWPTRFWARCTVELGDDPLLHACALTYLSDISTGVLPALDGSASPGASLDHALWLHAPVNANDWVLNEYHPQITGDGRGWYTGTIFTADGTAVASLAQEALFR